MSEGKNLFRRVGEQKESDYQAGAATFLALRLALRRGEPSPVVDIGLGDYLKGLPRVPAILAGGLVAMVGIRSRERRQRKQLRAAARTIRPRRWD